MKAAPISCPLGWRQRGASAIEFAFVFPVLFLLVYGVIVYSYVYVLQQSITFAAQHAAEAVSSVAMQPVESYDKRVLDHIRSTVTEQLRWLPEDQRSRVLGTSGANVTADFSEVDGSSVVRVGLRFDLPGLFPSVELPLVGKVPPLPPALIAQATARL